jgi:ATP-dependent DNA helicase DinG
MPSKAHDLDALLDAAVQGIGGVRRPGQAEMVHAVADAIAKREHLLVQAGTGTGKSLAYLIPAVVHALDTGRPSVVATATLTLQAQIVDFDMPRLAKAIAPILGRQPTYALVKGRRNYLCRHKLSGGFPADDEGSLLSVGAVDANASWLGAEVVRLRSWAETTQSGDRDELLPGASERAWRQVSVAAHECLGQKCPMATECFVEQARSGAKDVDVVVTNHAFMAIDSFEGRQMLPEHDLLIVDEGHDLVDRVTSTITGELTVPMIAGAAKRAGRLTGTDQVTDASEFLGAIVDEMPEGRLNGIPDSLSLALARVRDSARGVQTELKPASPEDNDGARQVARAAIDEIFENAERILQERELDVAWVSKDPRRGSVLKVAPMSVAMLMRDKIFGDRTVIMTSATLELGGTFDAVAGTLGLRGEGAPTWRGLDVGSPFDYPKQAIAYVAKHLPAPGRDGMAAEMLDEIEELVRAAGGRTLGLFSSMRAAVAATEAMRERFGKDTDSAIEFICQGEDQTSTLVRTFARDARTCLFGTLSLWQGVDVPGSSCQLVIIDRIPFPRPDDPLSSARSQAIARMGGNGFMAVSATHAALRLAQGAGRLVRRRDDRGVVAILDSRMMTARYAGFLQKSLPPFWPTIDKAMVLAALRRLEETADEPLPVHEPALRGIAGVVDGIPMGGEDQDDPLADDRPVAGDPPVAGSVRTAVTQGHAWTSEQDTELREGVELGLTLDVLASHLELEDDVIVARLNLFGLELSDSPKMAF